MPPEACAVRLRSARPAAILLALGAAIVTPPALAQAPQEGAADSWYRVEILVFRQPGDSGLAAEAWDPEPALAYPARHRHLIDRGLADARLRAFPGSQSRLDQNGRQQLTLPEPQRGSPPELISPDSSPIDTPPLGEDIPDPGAAPGQPDTATSAVPGEEQRAASGALPIDPDRPDALLDQDNAEVPLPAPAPYTLLPESLRELNRDASRMRAAGYAILYHEAWIQPVADEAAARAIILDRSGDPDSGTWPALQGSVTLHLSRYLHAATHLWLNTDGNYLHPEWRMPEPPRSPPSLALTLPVLEDWYREREDGATAVVVTRPDASLAAPERERTAAAPPPDSTGDSGAAPETDYPWRHAISLEQSRRMRAGELHYLDHPVLGVLIKLTPVDAALWRESYRATLDWQWEDRHNVLRRTPAVSPPPERRP